uniref:HTH psq-type domain-containing protein n=1 Tax=Anguilla anguilla TaxID=7936 RepID=A0A0E9WL49_ANGAN
MICVGIAAILCLSVNASKAGHPEVEKSHRDIAEMLGVSKSTVRCIVSSKNVPVSSAMANSLVNHGSA